MRSGSIGLVPQFVGVASADGSFDLQTITCNDSSSDSVSFQVLNKDGLGGDFYYWINWYQADENSETESCWVDGGFQKVMDFTLQPGEGLWVAVAGEYTDQCITFPGVEL